MKEATHAPFSNGLSVRVDRVSKSFGSRAVLSDISFIVEPGEIVSIIGRSGVGKSTLLRVVAGLSAPDRGQVIIGDTAADEARQQKQVGFLPQAPALMPWRTVAANVSLSAEVNRRANHPTMSVQESLAAVGLADRQQSFPHELSGGMQQRVALARALYTGAPLLLFDEPFASLDEVTRTSLYELLGDIWASRRPTMMFVTHNITEAVLLSDRVMVLAEEHTGLVGSIDVPPGRPRIQAIDGGALQEQVGTLRSWLQGGRE